MKIQINYFIFNNIEEKRQGDIFNKSMRLEV